MKFAKESTAQRAQTILIVEDDPLIHKMISDTLGVGGYTILDADDGLEGLRLARQYLPDLIISDVNMPEMDGYQLLAHIRQEESTATIPFVFLTAKDTMTDLRQGMELGAEDYLTKPFTARQLLHTVNVQLGKRQTLSARYESTINLLRKNITYALPHEIRTPLMSILGAADMMILEHKELDSESLLEMAKLIFDAGKRLHHLLENYLTYAQIEVYSRNAEDWEALNNHLIPSAASIIHKTATEIAEKYNRLDDLHIQLEDSALQIFGENLAKIVWELTDNAFKFSKEGARVIIRSKIEDGYYKLFIRDHGRGMSSEQIKQLGAYIQFDRALYEQQGLGLGFVIARRLIDLHQGLIDIRSAPGRGTLIEIGFPR